MSIKRPYVVRDRFDDGAIRIVITTSKPRAVGFVTHGRYSAEATSPYDVALLIDAGVKPEDCGDATIKRPYTVRDELNGDVHLVAAGSAASAIAFVSNDRYYAEAASSLEVMILMDKGVKPEYPDAPKDAGAEAEAGEA